MLIVKGDKQVKVGNATESKQFNRELTIPEFVDVKALQSSLSDDGMLTMEAPVLMDRFYSNNNQQALTSGSSYRQASPGRVLDTVFDAGRRPSPSHFGLTSTNQNPSGNYSSTSSTSSFRQETNRGSDSGGFAGSNNFHRNSPLRDHYSSTSSASTLVGGSGNASHLVHSNPVTYSTRAAPLASANNERYDGTKNVTYEFDLHEFAPEEIGIQVNDTMLKVSALRQERSGNGSAHREFKREIGKTTTKRNAELRHFHCLSRFTGRSGTETSDEHIERRWSSHHSNSCPRLSTPVNTYLSLATIHSSKYIESS